MLVEEAADDAVKVKHMYFPVLLNIDVHELAYLVILINDLLKLQSVNRSKLRS